MEPTENEQITIGEFTIKPFHVNDGTFWIEHSSGEGMQVSGESLIKLINQFYTENF